MKFSQEPTKYIYIIRINMINNSFYCEFPYTANSEI